MHARDAYAAAVTIKHNNTGTSAVIFVPCGGASPICTPRRIVTCNGSLMSIPHQAKMAHLKTFTTS